MASIETNTDSNKKLKESNVKEERAYNRFKMLVDEIISDDQVKPAFSASDVDRVKTRECAVQSIVSVLSMMSMSVNLEQPLLSFYILNKNFQKELVKSHVLLYLSLIVDAS